VEVPLTIDVPADLSIYTKRGIMSLILQNQRVIFESATQKTGVIMASLADLQAQLDSISASESAEATQLATLGGALTEIIQMLQAEPTVPDAIVQRATDIAAQAAANTQTAASEAKQASDAAQPTP
jgi:hypothetical protein